MNTVANNILNQLGGNKFMAMTGAKNLTYDANSLNINLPKNISKANNLKIVLNGNDLYNVSFTKFSGGKMNLKTFEFTELKVKKIQEFDNVHAEDLQELFTSVTGFDTKL